MCVSGAVCMGYWGLDYVELCLPWLLCFSSYCMQMHVDLVFWSYLFSTAVHPGYICDSYWNGSDGPYELGYDVYRVVTGWWPMMAS